MKTSRFTDRQIICRTQASASRSSVPELCREHGIILGHFLCRVANPVGQVA